MERILSIRDDTDLDEMEGHLPTDGLVPVNIGYIFDIWLAFHMLERRDGHDANPQISAWEKKKNTRIDPCPKDIIKQPDSLTQ